MAREPRHAQPEVGALVTVKFQDGFEHYTTILDKWSATNGGNQGIGAYGRNGSQGLYAVHNVGGCRKDLPASYGTLICGFAFQRTVAGTSGLSFFYFTDANTEQVSLRLSAGGTAELTRQGTVLATGTTVLAVNAFNYIELKIVCADAGSYELRINGILEFSGAGDTKATANATMNGIVLGTRVNFDNTQTQMRFDDVYLVDTTAPNGDFLGDVRVAYLAPNGNGASSQFVGSDLNSVDNYLLVDEVPANDDTDYVQSDVLNNIDTYALADLPANAGVVKSVMSVMKVRKDDAGARSIASVLRHGATDNVGVTKALLTTYATEYEIHDVNPVTAVAWTTADVNALQAGVKVVV